MSLVPPPCRACNSDFPALPNGCYEASPPLQDREWQNNQPQSSVYSAPLLIYPPLPATNPGVFAQYDGSYVFAGNDTFVRAISARTGRWRWTFGAGAAVTAPLGYDTARGNVLAGTVRGAVFAIGVTNGTLAWVVTGLGGSITLAGVVYSAANDLVLVGSAGGRFTALDAGTGRVVWTYIQSFSAVETTPVVSLNGATAFFAAHTGLDDVSSNWMLGGIYALNTTRATLSSASRLIWIAYLAPNGEYFGQVMPKLVLSADGERVYATTRSYLKYMGSSVFALSTALQPRGTSQILWMVRTGPSPWIMMNSPSLYDGSGSEFCCSSTRSPRALRCSRPRGGCIFCS